MLHFSMRRGGGGVKLIFSRLISGSCRPGNLNTYVRTAEKQIWEILGYTNVIIQNWVRLTKILPISVHYADF